MQNTTHAPGPAARQEARSRAMANRAMALLDRAPPLFLRRQEPKIYGRVGDLEVRLAVTLGEIKLAQRLRFQVVYEEMSAVPSRLAQFRRREEDA